ncbi:MAG: hypothetical protein R2850_13555 [Bacteroidia bacterium]
MLKSVRDDMIEYGAGYSNWGMLALEKLADPIELVITGNGALDEAQRLSKKYQPTVFIAASEKNSAVPFV